MEKEFILKKTNELTHSEKNQMIELFIKVFNRPMSREYFDRRFLNSPKGYAYHGLMLHNNKIVGSFTAIPYRYTYYGRDMMFGLSVDTMIAREHRGGKANLQHMAKLVYDAMIEEGITFIYGFPNELYYSHEKRIHQTRDIGRLSYYILPFHIGNLHSSFKFLNPLSYVVCKIKLFLSRARQKEEKAFYPIDKIADNEFENHRYDNTYTVISLANGAKCIYKIYTEKEKVRTLHILDVIPLTSGAFMEAVRKISKEKLNSLDAILYVGNPHFAPPCLFRVPRFLEPQKIRMTGKILDPNQIDERVWDIKNWNANVSNFDVR